VTKEEILTIEAGRKLDGLVGQEVMGVKVEYPFGSRYPYYLREGKWDTVAPYSTDIKAAWEVVEKLRGHEFRMHNEYHDEKWHGYCGIEQPEDLGEGYFSATAEYLPEAICKAALLTRLGGSNGSSRA